MQMYIDPRALFPYLPVLHFTSWYCPDFLIVHFPFSQFSSSRLRYLLHRIAVTPLTLISIICNRCFLVLHVSSFFSFSYPSLVLFPSFHLFQWNSLPVMDHAAMHGKSKPDDFFFNIDAQSYFSLSFRVYFPPSNYWFIFWFFSRLLSTVK